MGKNTQTQQKQKILLHECGFSKLKASRTKKVNGNIICISIMPKGSISDCCVILDKEKFSINAVSPSLFLARSRSRNARTVLDLEKVFSKSLSRTGSPLFPRMLGGKENPRKVKSVGTEI